jgi:hypothetical protein
LGREGFDGAQVLLRPPHFEHFTEGLVLRS